MTDLATSVLNKKEFQQALNFLSNKDSDLANVIELYGPPPFRHRKPGFGTLIHIILEQQVSLASARATFIKTKNAVPKLIPKNFLILNDNQLKNLGYSRQKMDYCRNLAEAIQEGEINLKELDFFSDDAVRQKLTAIKGIGVWTANIYLLIALWRSDVWPVNDLALVKALQKVKNLPGMPDTEQCIQIGELWRPYRSVATRILWHYYLSQNRKSI